MPDVVTKAICSHIELEGRVGGYEAAAAQSTVISSAYGSIANLLGAKRENIAFTENSTVSFSQALSSIDFSPGDVILTTRNDYASNQIQFLSLQNRLVVMQAGIPEN